MEEVYLHRMEEYLRNCVEEGEIAYIDGNGRVMKVLVKPILKQVLQIWKPGNPYEEIRFSAYIPCRSL